MQITLEELNVISRLPHYCPVCAYKEWGLEELVHMCWEYLDLLRIYTKPKVCTDSRDETCWPNGACVAVGWLPIYPHASCDEMPLSILPCSS